RMRDQAFDTTERFGEREQLQPADELPHRLGTAFELERHDGTEAALLASGEFVPRMRREPRVVHLRDPRLLREPCGEALRIALMHGEACVQRAQPPKREEAVER